jgi:diacylglycerol kinase family enzyme
MDEMPQPPDLLHRAAAAAALLLVLGVIALTVAAASGDIPLIIAQLALVAFALFGGWVGLTRTGRRRVAAAALAVAALVGIVVLWVARQGLDTLSLTVRVVGIAATIGLARYAVGTTAKALQHRATPGTPVPAAANGVLFMNLKSGGGKAERFHLVDECRQRGIEPVVLEAGQDWVAIIRESASRHDVVGMAGGDGSQALVGSIAAELGLPMVVVPAGTRNHLALDLGLDREDVVGALEAYGEAVERPMDLADVNGHVFVNNVSLGLYAAIVRSPEYRDAKADTTLATLPKVLAPGTAPFDLHFDGPDGHHEGAHVIQISNNPYGTTLSGLGSRPRLDTQQLGVVSLVLEGDRAIARFLAALATGAPGRFDGLTSWSTPSFVVSSGSAIEIGLDGETQVMDSPLRFSIRPDPVRVRLPRSAIGYSPAGRSLGWRRATPALWAVLLGRPSRPASLV